MLGNHVLLEVYKSCFDNNHHFLIQVGTTASSKDGTQEPVVKCRYSQAKGMKVIFFFSFSLSFGGGGGGRVGIIYVYFRMSVEN